MGDFSENILLFKEKIMFKSLLIKSRHRVLRKNEVYIYGAPILQMIIASQFQQLKCVLL
jgi:hypothetical protein